MKNLPFINQESTDSIYIAVRNLKKPDISADSRTGTARAKIASMIYAIYKQAKLLPEQPDKVATRIDEVF